MRLRFHNPLRLKKIFDRQNWTWKNISKALLWGLVGLVILTALLFAWFARDLPTPGKIRKRTPPEATRIYDRNGNQLYDIFGEQKRMVIDFKDIPDTVKQATIAAEDKDFYKHHGVRFRSVLRAAYYNIIRHKTTQGGSTITQQYVKNALLSPKRTYTRKIKELILSLEMEVMFSKDQILGFYLNEIPYGANAYGIEAAAETYFGIHAKELTLVQSVLLVSLPKAPTYYSPYGSHSQELLGRKDYVLDRMTELKMITKEQADQAKKEKITFSKKRNNIIAPHFVLYIKELLVDKYGEQMVNEGGLRVTTTLDPDKQKLAEEAVTEGAKRNLKRNGATNAALVSLDPKTGQILAMVGSVDYFDMEHDGQFNVTTASRQPGSAFKPVVYATAFKGKYNPAFVLFDLETDFGNYTPQNYDGSFHGPVTARYALGNSYNLPAVKMLALAGIKNVLRTAKEMGITTLNQPERYGLSLVLGGGEVKPLDMATAFGVFANQGVLAPTTPFLKIEDSKGNILEEFKEGKNSRNVLDPQIAFQISDILSDNNARSAVFGSRSSLYFDERKVAVKTGTTSEFRDAWTVGYTPTLVSAVWVGNNDNSPMSGQAAGAMAAAPIFHQYMAKALGDKPNEDFFRPDGLKEVTVDKFSNKLPSEDSPEDQRVRDIFASWQVPTQYDDIHVRGRVNKINGKLATDLTPPELVEERTYTNLHSEMPDKANWEGPVRAWARNNDMANSPPTDKDDLYSESQLPTVKILSPANNATLNGAFEISVSSQATFNVKTIEFYIDNVSVGSDSSAPYSLGYTTNSLSGGQHTISVSAIDSYGAVGRAQITINVDKSSGFSLTNFGASNITANSAVVSWNTNEPADSQLEYGTTNALGSSTSLDSTMTNAHSVTLSGLASHTTYYLRAKSRNASGTTATSDIITFTTT